MGLETNYPQAAGQMDSQDRHIQVNAMSFRKAG